MNISARRFLLPMILSALLLLMLVIPAAAQSRSVGGKVTDDKSQPVADAQISIIGTDIYRNLTAKTNKKGEYFYLLGLQSGIYRIVVRKPGFQPTYKENIQPPLGEKTEVNFTLTPGEDYKLPFEMTAAEIEKIKQQAAQGDQRKQLSAEVKANFTLGNQLVEQGKYPEAIDAYNKALEKSPNQPGILSRLADAYAKSDKNDEAIAAYDKAIALNATDPNSYTNKGIVLSKIGKIAESQALFQKAAEMSPAMAAQNYFNLGVTLFNNSRYDEAIDALKKSIAADPNFAESYYQIGMCYSSKQDTIPAAIEALEKYILIGKKPDRVEVAKQILSALKKK